MHPSHGSKEDNRSGHTTNEPKGTQQTNDEMEVEREANQAGEKGSEGGKRPTEGRELDLNEPPSDNAMIIHAYQNTHHAPWHPNPYQTDNAHNHQTETPNVNPAAQEVQHIPTICITYPHDGMHTSNHNRMPHIACPSQTHIIPETPRLISHPMIIQLPDSPEPPLIIDHPEILRPYTVENPLETPPKLPYTENPNPTSGLSPFMNKMTLKGMHEEADEEMPRAKRSKQGESGAKQPAADERPKGRGRLSPKRKATRAKTSWK